MIELLAALLSYCLWLFVFSWFKSKREIIDLGILSLLGMEKSCDLFEQKHLGQLKKIVKIVGKDKALTKNV